MTEAVIADGRATLRTTCAGGGTAGAALVELIDRQGASCAEKSSTPTTRNSASW